MQGPAVRQKISSEAAPASAYPFMKRPSGSGQATRLSRLPQGTRERAAEAVAAPEVVTAAQDGTTKNARGGARTGAAIAANDQTTTTVDGRPASQRGGGTPGGDNGLQPRRDKQPGRCLCVLYLTGAGTLLLLATAYYLSQGRSSGHQKQPVLLVVSRASPTPSTAASGATKARTSTFDGRTASVNSTAAHETTDVFLSSSAVPKEKLKKTVATPTTLTITKLSVAQRGESANEAETDVVQHGPRDVSRKRSNGDGLDKHAHLRGQRRLMARRHSRVVKARNPRKNPQR